MIDMIGFKRAFIGILALGLGLQAMGQNHQDLLDDSAKVVVDRYLQMLNIEGLPQDSLLVMETVITFYGHKDTIWMRRWYAVPEKFRVEVWNRGKLETGLVSNGKDRFRRYLPTYESWESITLADFHERMTGYDFRGPLYNWRAKGATLKWNGTTTLKGEPLQVVKVDCPAMYERYYMFEPESGLLTLIFETDNVYQDYSPRREGHIDWKSIHEYQPLATGILPSLESFMRGGVLTIMSSTTHFEKNNPEIFEHD